MKKKIVDSFLRKSPTSIWGFVGSPKGLHLEKLVHLTGTLTNIQCPTTNSPTHQRQSFSIATLWCNPKRGSTWEDSVKISEIRSFGLMTFWPFSQKVDESWWNYQSWWKLHLFFLQFLSPQNISGSQAKDPLKTAENSKRPHRSGAFLLQNGVSMYFSPPKKRGFCCLDRNSFQKSHRLTSKERTPKVGGLAWEWHEANASCTHSSIQK